MGGVYKIVSKVLVNMLKLVKSFNANFVSIIPKAGVVNIKDFCPISLVGGVYKIISKVLVNKLKLVLRKIISNSQNAFISSNKFWIQC